MFGHRNKKWPVTITYSGKQIVVVALNKKGDRKLLERIAGMGDCRKIYYNNHVAVHRLKSAIQAFDLFLCKCQNSVCVV